ncbi:MAG: FecR domain-containing protein [Opitutaceae bacterium]|nr:FecR domain-containing protein [Opitutaceae bacterium]
MSAFDPKSMPGKTTMTPDADAIEEIAAEWIARRHGGLSPDDEAELHRWLSADPRHKKIFAEYESGWAAFQRPLRAGGAGVILGELEARERRRTHRRRICTMTTMGLAAAAAIALVFFSSRPRFGQLQVPPIPPTVALRPDLRTLPDGSVVELNAGAEITPAFTAKIRGVRLLRGTAFFTIAKDAAHPFVVTTGGIEVRAVGTAFAVRAEQKRVDVVVTEGRVAVQRVAPSDSDASSVPIAAEAIYLSAGRAAAVPANPSFSVPWEAKPLTDREAAAELAWRGRRLEFDGTPLSSAVELFNRQNGVKLLIADPSIRSLQITGIFWTDDPDGFVRLLERGLNLKAERSAATITLRGL